MSLGSSLWPALLVLAGVFAFIGKQDSAGQSASGELAAGPSSVRPDGSVAFSPLAAGLPGATVYFVRDEEGEVTVQCLSTEKGEEETLAKSLGTPARPQYLTQ
ncbi:hypothetical protein [Roseibacillus ishigakijimensis]|uniref:Uncharacterized protein n=1 Tax=Roseibacillus ishigakijimensis TaxID=454146 RepID=A0A934RR69_9BACT|nr:hypothetical protein [Roseibacillus ishigakijimensis]MBK1835418.1 hypothetical protein [Roseibacillus ishigakijimensis]